MAGSGDPVAMTAAEKLDFLVTQVMSLTDIGTKLSTQLETLNQRMDSHDTRLMRLETAAGKQPIDSEGSGLGGLTNEDKGAEAEESDAEDPAGRHPSPRNLNMGWRRSRQARQDDEGPNKFQH